MMNIIETIQAMWKNTVMLKNLIIISVPKIHIKNDLTIRVKIKKRFGDVGAPLNNWLLSTNFDYICCYRQESWSIVFV